MRLIFRVDDQIPVPARTATELALPRDRSEAVNLWLEMPLGGGAWTAAYRVVLTGTDRERCPVIGEVRIFPTEPDFTSRAPGEWSAEYRGIAAPVPARGVTGGLLKEIKASTIIRQLDAAVALTAAQHPELETIWPRWKGQPLGRRQLRKKRHSGRGRKPHPPWFLATVAKHYVHALRVAHVNPVPYIAAQYREQNLNRVRTWVLKARDEGFLIGRREAGKAGGALSPTAELVLKEHERSQRWEKL